MTVPQNTTNSAKIVKLHTETNTTYTWNQLDSKVNHLQNRFPQFLNWVLQPK